MPFTCGPGDGGSGLSTSRKMEEQAPETIAAAVEEYLAAHPKAVVLDDGKRRQEVILDSPRLGLYIPPMTWSVQHKYSRDAVLLALVSDVYDASDYIRDYGEFVALRETAFRMVPSETNDPLE